MLLTADHRMEWIMVGVATGKPQRQPNPLRDFDCNVEKYPVIS
jgi:hypothetical protein